MRRVAVLTIQSQRRYAAHGCGTSHQPCAAAHGYKRESATRLLPPAAAKWGMGGNQKQTNHKKYKKYTKNHPHKPHFHPLTPQKNSGATPL
jgi:hypothetical protein